MGFLEQTIKGGKKMKKMVTASIVAIGLLSLAACGKTASSGASSNEMKKVGVLQVVQHESLDAAYKGFKEGLKEGGYTEGKNITFDYQNAQNNQDNLKSMSEKLVKEKPDLLLGIATPSAQSLANETQDIPIVITAVTDPVAAKLAKTEKKPGGNITGTTDMVPIAKQIDLLLSIVPKAKTIGIMYNAGESNSKIQADLAEKSLKKAGVAVKVLTANTTNDVQQVTTSLAKDVDGIYVPTDNTFASAATIVGEVAKETKTPIVAGSVEQVEQGGLATYGIDYEALGKQTGLMAAKILDGDAKPRTTAIESAKDLKLTINKDMAKALDIDPISIKLPE